MKNHSNQNNRLKIRVNIQIPQSEPANHSHPKVLKSRNYKRRHAQKRKKEFERLIAENRILKDIIGELISHYSQVHATDMRKNENSSCCQNDRSFYLQEHQQVESDLGASTDRLNGLGLNDLLGNLLSDEVEGPNQQNTMAEFLIASNGDVPDV